VPLGAQQMRATWRSPGFRTSRTTSGARTPRRSAAGRRHWRKGVSKLRPPSCENPRASSAKRRREPASRSATAASFGPALRFHAVNLAELGRLDESQETVARLLELEPNLTLSVLRGRAPIADPKLMDLFLNGLRKAGTLDSGTVGLQKLEEPQKAGHQKTVRVPFGCRSAAILPSEGVRTIYVLV
jgi:hypothetical protein